MLNDYSKKQSFNFDEFLYQFSILLTAYTDFEFVKTREMKREQKRKFFTIKNHSLTAKQKFQN